MSSYQERFPVGSKVRVRPEHELKAFADRWQWHNPLTDEQLDQADVFATVLKVGFYHGGDALYVLSDLPGQWHEECLAAV